MYIKTDQTANDRIAEMEDKSIEKIQTKAEREKKKEQNIFFQTSTVDMQNKVKKFDICLIGMTERDE